MLYDLFVLGGNKSDVFQITVSWHLITLITEEIHSNKSLQSQVESHKECS